MKDYDSNKVNGDPQPPDEVNNMFSELKTMLSSLGISFNAGSVQQLAEAIEVLATQGKYFDDSGTANTYVLGASPSTRKNPPSYFAGMEVYFFPDNTNTGASTVNVGGLGLKSILRYDGSTALSGGEIVADRLIRLVYDGTNFRIPQIVPNESTFVTGSYVGSGGTETISGLSFRPELVEIFLVTSNISVFVHDDLDPAAGFHGAQGAAGANYNITITADGFQATGSSVITNTNKFFWKAIKP